MEEQIYKKTYTRREYIYKKTHTEGYTYKGIYTVVYTYDETYTQRRNTPLGDIHGGNIYRVLVFNLIL